MDGHTTFVSGQRDREIFRRATATADLVRLSLARGGRNSHHPACGNGNGEPDASLRLDYALYKSQQKQESPNKIFSRRELVMASGGIPATNYKDVKNFFDSVKTGDDQTALVKLSQNVATAK